MPPALGWLADRGHDGGRLQPIKCCFEPVVIARAGAAANKGQDFVRRRRHQARCLQTSVAGFDNLARRPDQHVGVPDGRHAVLRHGFDANADFAGVEIDRDDTLRFGEREERISHQILGVAGREIAGKRSKQF